MTFNEDPKDLAARVLEKNKGLEGIYAQPDFQDWLELVPKAELDAIKDRIVKIDRSNPEWRNIVADLVIEYQALHRGIFTLTETRLQAVKAARQVLKSETE